MEFSDIMSIGVMVFQFVIGAIWWATRTQIRNLRDDIIDLRSRMLTKEEFRMYRQGVQNGRH